MAEAYYSTVFEKIKSLTRERGVTFSPSPKSPSLEWMIQFLVRPRERSFFGIEGEASGIVGFALVPEPTREYAELAWNRIEGPLREGLARLQANGYEGKRINCLFLQIWEADKRSVLIPFKQLTELKRFRDKGDFRIKKNDEGFFLETPRGEENIKLKDRLEDLFLFL